MKRAFILLTVLFPLIYLNSCVIIDGGEDAQRKTAAAKIVYDETENNISAILVMTDISIKLSKWIDAPESQKDSIEDLYFPDFKPRFANGRWSLLNSSYYILPDTHSLSMTGAEWKATAGEDEPYAITIKCTGNDTWSVTCANASIIGTTINSSLVVKGVSTKLDTKLALFDYIISGSGSLLPDASDRHSRNHINIAFNIKDGIRFIITNSDIVGSNIYNLNSYRGASGDMEMTVQNLSDADQSDAILVEIIAYTDYGVVKYFTFKGAREVWTY